MEATLPSDGVPPVAGDELEAPGGGSGAAPAGPGGGSAAPKCPTSTKVDATEDLTTKGLDTGYLTGYGIRVKMKVLPDTTNWNGVDLVEEVKDASGGTCPAEFPKQCEGSSTFTVGAAAGKSSLADPAPGEKNRFFDYHSSKWKGGSILHTAKYNPKGVASCTSVCEQTYKCGSKGLGTHTITRTFAKATHNGNDVTKVTAKKT